MRLKVAQHPHDIRMLEVGQRPRFLDEVLEAKMVIPHGLWSRLGGDGGDVLAHGQIGGEILLDGDAGIEVTVAGQVGNAKAAVSQHRLDGVFHQLKVVRQGIFMKTTHIPGISC